MLAAAAVPEPPGLSTGPRPLRYRLRLHLRILGRLQVRDAYAADFTPTAGKPRQLLAFLLLNAGELVRVEDCISELWGATPPRSVNHTLQTYARTIRQALTRALPTERARLVTSQSCYRLVVEPDLLDAAVFERVSRLGMAAARAGDHHTAAALLTRALQDWGGEVLADVESGPLAKASVVRLHETHRAALEQRIDSDLHLGRHWDLVPELARRCAKHPTYESLRAQHMLALHRCGQDDAAIRVFEELKVILADRFGIEPGPRVMSLYRTIRSGDT